MGELPFEKKERKIIERRKEEGEFGVNPSDRSIEKILDYGVVNLNKPRGPTSHHAVTYLKKILDLDKGGHSGTLDPGVGGVLPVCIGKATKVVQTLLPAGKEYVAIMHLHGEVKNSQLKRVMKLMRGNIKQMPPVKSAVNRKERFRKIYYSEILEVEGQDVLFRMGCEAGTYIRKYIHDIGEILGCGAHMEELFRTKVGPFNDCNMVTLHDLSDAHHFYKENGDEKIKDYILPVEKAVENFPKIWVSDSAIKSILNGVNVKVPGVVRLNEVEPQQTVAVMTLKDELLAIGECQMNSKKILEENNGVVVNTEKVLYK